MSTFLGMLSAFGLVIAAIMIGGDPLKFINLQGILIVFFGTFAVTGISFRFSEIIGMPSNIFRVLQRGHIDLSEEAIKMLKIAQEARRLNDDLKLEKLLPAVKSSPVLHKAIQLIVDGHTADEIEQVLRRESSTNSDRHMRAVAFLRRAGDVAPAMGLIGTLIGLIKMLGALDDPSAIGPAMAVALLTTFYGALMAHLVFIPLAAKTEHCSSEETLVNNLYTMGAASIRRRENPRRLEMLLNTVLPPAKRVTFFQ
ncbi:MotA/TolQ/ExbB proton channel family protein [Temperatibacter marinus]|uniref:MotA/TolQ/ExbB proton channel family protein n=1 Tax=Temperatibacter marinus TaxID=1456591 RepID=A0AA52EIM9_9PROT|nr:MotA/TolQ/ExbB proton channel family protein [Temperatibacter marinus]WND02741.1 MotA/TolQ/ExbB proton channel family protein [Temperatibacter marinus]